MPPALIGPGMLDLIALPSASAFILTTVTCADGIEVDTVRILKAGVHTGHHAHAYDHTTVVVRGAVNAWADGESLGRYDTGTTLQTRAGVKHHFEALEDDTTYVCVHNVSRTGAIEIADPYTLKDAP